jgi:N-acetylglucosaminylphosphatidylinositol deacetylase
MECLNNEKLKDSMESIWPKDEIQSIVLKYVKENNIKAIFTFDSYGVSNHPNHKSISAALKDL